MRYKEGNPATCRHSRGSSASGYGSRTVAVYSTCKNPQKQRLYKGYMIEDRSICENCGHQNK